MRIALIVSLAMGPNELRRPARLHVYSLSRPDIFPDYSDRSDRVASLYQGRSRNFFGLPIFTILFSPVKSPCARFAAEAGLFAAPKRNGKAVCTLKLYFSKWNPQGGADGPPSASSVTESENLESTATKEVVGNEM